MSQHPATNPSLLLRLRDCGNQRAWDEFVQIYAPLIFGFCRKHKLQHADALDVTQEVFLSVLGSISDFEYRPARGRFRGWLLTVTRSKLSNYFRRLNRYNEVWSDAATHLGIQWDGSETQPVDWERDYRRYLFEWAAAKVQQEVAGSTWNAFVETVLRERSNREVAAELGVSVGAVYIAKSRVLSRLKQLMSSVDESGEVPPMAVLK